MNQRPLKNLLGLAAKACLVSLFGCGASGAYFTLKPKLPASIKSQDWGAIRERASHWELTVTPRAQGKGAAEPAQTWTFAASSAELPLVDLPGAASGKWELALKLWGKAKGKGAAAVWFSGRKTVERERIVNHTSVEIPLTAVQ